ncbi:hypothetical protein NC652_029119 [Populus alba x Populus x berolinensis]|nr:hypothetical protein NC652_029119 [Populus alba x Populus x berolinensis]
MAGYIPHPPAQDSATSGYSTAAKGGLAGVLVILLAIVVYVFLKRQNCLEEGDPGKVQVINIVEMGERSAGNKELCCSGFLARSVLFPVGKGGEHGAVSSIKIYIWCGGIRVNFGLLKKIANKICGCCCTGASIPFLSEIHVDRLYNQTQNALFSFSITAMIKFCFVSGSQIHEGNRGCRRTATATPNRDCGCSRGLQQVFDSDCYGDGPNHLVTRIKSGRSPIATITGQCMPVNNAVGAAPPLSSPVVPSNLVKKIVFFFFPVLF